MKSDTEAVPYILSQADDPATEVVLSSAAPVALAGSPAMATAARGFDFIRFGPENARGAPKRPTCNHKVGCRMEGGEPITALLEIFSKVSHVGFYRMTT